MPWFRTDDDLPEHVKADLLEAAAGDPATLAAAWMTWLHMGCDCAKRRTDGLFPRARAHRAVRLPSAMVDAGLAALVSARLIHREEPDSFRFHDWADYQPTRADLEEQRKAATERQRKRRGLSQRDTAVTDSVTPAVSQAVSRPESHERGTATSPAPVTAPRPVPSRPDPESEIQNPEIAEVGAAPLRLEPQGVDPAPAPAAAPSRPRRAPKPPPPAELPPTDPRALAVYRVIVADRVLQPITARPADLAERLTAPGAFPGVDVLAQVHRAAAHAAGPRAHYRDGRAFLLGWMGRADKTLPEPSPLASGVFLAPTRAPSRSGIPSARDHIARREAALPTLPTAPEVSRAR